MTKSSKKREQRASAPAATTGDRAKRGGTERESPAASSKKAKGISGVPGSKNDSRRCTATANRSGERCKAPAIKGGTVCRMHGGSLPQVKKAAKERLQELVDPFITELRRIVFDPDTDAAVKVRGIVAVLDRTGYGPGSKLEVSTGPSKWDEALIVAAGGEVVDGEVVYDPTMHGGVDRSSLGDLDYRKPRAFPSEGGGGDPLGFEDVEQHVRDANDEAWRESGYDAEDEEPYRTRIRRDGNTVSGTVVGRYDVPPDPDPLDPPAYGRENARERRARRP